MMRKFYSILNQAPPLYILISRKINQNDYLLLFNYPALVTFLAKGLQKKVVIWHRKSKTHRFE